MLCNKSSGDDYWCPTDDTGRGPALPAGLTLTARESTALFRFGSGDWISDAQIERLQELGFIEKAFGQPVLTRLGRNALGLAE